MALTEGWRTLFSSEIICAILAIVLFVVLCIFSLALHIKFNHICSFTVSIFTYVLNVALFGFTFMIFSFYSRLVPVIVMYLTLMFFFFFITVFILSLAGYVDGRRLDEPKLVFLQIFPMWSTVIGITIWLAIGNHASFAHILIGFFCTIILSVCIT